MKLSHMMSRVGVRPRVFGGFALVLSFLVLLAGFAMVQVERIGGTVNELVTSAAGDAGYGLRKLPAICCRYSCGSAPGGARW